MDKYVICPLCGGRMVWSTSEMACEHYDYDEEDTAVVSYYRCQRCGRDYEIVDPPKQERLTEFSDYWNG